LGIVLSMLLLGLLLGFIGGTGGGFIIAILTLGFNIPIHTALGTSLASMAFTCLSGIVSHYREGNVVLKAGIIVGLFGAAGAYGGSLVAAIIPKNLLHWFTGGTLIFFTFLLIYRLYLWKESSSAKEAAAGAENNTLFYVKAVVLGIVSGILSGAFGVGAGPFIQFGLIVFLGLSIRHSVGTAMVVMLPVAIGGGLGFNTGGYLDIVLLLQILAGTMTGSYIGAKFTKFAPKIVLKTAMVITPAVAGMILLMG